MSRPRSYMPAAPELKTLIGVHQVWVTVFSWSCRILWPIWKAVNSTTSSSQLRTCSLVLARRNAICWLVVSRRNVTGIFLYSSDNITTNLKCLACDIISNVVKISKTSLKKVKLLRNYNMVTTSSLQPHNMYYVISVHTGVHVEVCAKFDKNPSICS